MDLTVLCILIIDTLGRFWGADYQPWADINISECDLVGITCVNGNVARIDLTGAEICSNGDRRPGPVQYCIGLPTELGLLTHLEVFQLTRRQYLRGSLPSELGQLSLLRLLDVSTCTSMSGTIPTEFGRLSSLKRLMLSHSGFHGTIPTELYRLTNLEKVYLTNNKFEGRRKVYL